MMMAAAGGGEPEPVFSGLCLTAEEANSTVSMKANGAAPTVTLEYSEDGKSWLPFVVGETTVTLESIGDKCYLRGDNSAFGSSSTNYHKFVMTGKIAASGNITSLLDKTVQSTQTQNYAFNNLFKDCWALTSAPELPATILGESCYANMFRECRYLSVAPFLPSENPSQFSYEGIFINSGVKDISVGFKSWGWHTSNWVYGLGRTGVFRCPEELPDQRGDDKIPEGWTIVRI